jgi:methyl-accepting chemotaxis protein
MFGFGGGTDPAKVLEALGRSLAIIEFDPTGIIIGANENFCKAMGYSEAEIRGKHHSMFCDPAYAKSAEYASFWTRLGSGAFHEGEYKRLAKGGREIWIQASYNPILNARGGVARVVKLASDITAAKARAIDTDGKLQAISRALAMIEFTPSGHILDANENFLGALGYRLDEIKGQHHRMFVDPAEAQSPAYQELWRTLGRGEFFASEFKRIGKGGKEVWIQASYNPILAPDKTVIKVVKFATDVTARVQAVAEVGGALQRLANNNLERKIESAFPPELTAIRDDFNTAIDAIRETLHRMGDATQAIQAGTGELSSSTHDLSRRTEQQAASLEETAAALDEITATVRKSAEGATHAREVVASADADAKKSATVVHVAVTAMEAIAKSSNQISQIIGVIDEIAFQTNLLALNAGVEAARAGDAGRGFAVVASEVRALAQRSADAAKEIKGLISTSTAQVGEGVKLVGETGAALDRIVAQVAEINTVISDIAGGAKEQSVALAEVNIAVNQMDQTTQQNAAMVEEVTAATGALAEEATKLAELWSMWKIDDGIRSALKSVTPHAFKQHPSSRPPARGAAGPRPVAKTASGGGADSWEEF